MNTQEGAYKYPLEKILRDIACTDGSYVMALFDCCRERLPQEEMRGRSTYDEDEDILNEPKNEENLIITFGCMPSAGVPAKSTVARAYFRHLRHSARVKDLGVGNLVLPGNLSFFNGTDGRVEHTTRVTAPLLLKWTDRLTNAGMDCFATKSNFFDASNFADDGNSPSLEHQGSWPATDPSSEEASPYLREDSGLTDFTEEFTNQEADTDNFFDFTEALQKPQVQIVFQNMRMLQNVCLLPNMHMLIEGGLLD